MSNIKLFGSQLTELTDDDCNSMNSQTKEGMTFLKVPVQWYQLSFSGSQGWVPLFVDGYSTLCYTLATSPRKPKGGAKIWSPVASFR